MARYGQAFRDRIVARLLPPESAAIDVVSRGAVLRGGAVLANGSLSIVAGGAVDNRGGSLQAVTGLALTGGSLANAGGLVASDGNVAVQADAGVAESPGVRDDVPR